MSSIDGLYVVGLGFNYFLLGGPGLVQMFTVSRVLFVLFCFFVFIHKKSLALSLKLQSTLVPRNRLENVSLYNSFNLCWRKLKEIL